MYFESGMTDGDNVATSDDRGRFQLMTIQVSPVSRMKVFQPPYSVAAGNQGVLQRYGGVWQSDYVAARPPQGGDLHERVRLFAAEFHQFAGRFCG